MRAQQRALREAAQYHRRMLLAELCPGVCAGCQGRYALAGLLAILSLLELDHDP